MKFVGVWAGLTRWTPYLLIDFINATRAEADGLSSGFSDQQFWQSSMTSGVLSSSFRWGRYGGCSQFFTRCRISERTPWYYFDCNILWNTVCLPSQLFDCFTLKHVHTFITYMTIMLTNERDIDFVFKYMLYIQYTKKSIKNGNSKVALLLNFMYRKRRDTYKLRWMRS